MPRSSTEVWARLGLGDIFAVTDLAQESEWGRLPVGSPVVKGEALFQRIVDDAE
jgi:methionyl-tRNA synthetase